MHTGTRKQQPSQFLGRLPSRGLLVGIPKPRQIDHAAAGHRQPMAKFQNPAEPDPVGQAEQHQAQKKHRTPRHGQLWRAMPSRHEHRTDQHRSKAINSTRGPHPSRHTTQGTAEPIVPARPEPNHPHHGNQNTQGKQNRIQNSLLKHRLGNTRQRPEGRTQDNRPNQPKAHHTASVFG